jgi:shikimate kinase
MSQRVPLYRRVATIRVNTNRRNPGAVVRYIVSRLEEPQADGTARRRRPPWRRSPAPSQPDSETGPPPTPATPAALAAARRAEAGK